MYKLYSNLSCNITTCIFGRFWSNQFSYILKNIPPWVSMKGFVFLFDKIKSSRARGSRHTQVWICTCAPWTRNKGFKKGKERGYKRKAWRQQFQLADVEFCINRGKANMCRDRERLYAQSVALGMNVQSNHQCQIKANNLWGIKKTISLQQCKLAINTDLVLICIPI